MRGNIGIDVRARNFRQDIVRQARAAQSSVPPIRMKLNPRGFTQPLGRITGDMGEFQKSLDASVARTLAFGASVGVLMGVTRAFKSMVKAAVEVEKQLADVNVILQLNSAQLRSFSNDLFDVARNTGQAFESVATAAVELARQGLGAEEMLKRVNDAMILTRLSGMDSARAVETLTAALNGFKKAALDSTDVVNRLANVDASFAVSTNDLSNALSRAASTAQAARVSFNELLASVTSVQQSTARGGAVIGNAFKSIFTRIQRSRVRETLEGIGVATTTVNGEFRSAIAVLKDYAAVYDSLTDATKAYTDQQIAGVFQINNLRALIIDLKGEYSIFDRALKVANGTTNEAIMRNKELNKTMAALFAETAASAKELGAALGKALAEPSIKRVLDIFNSIAETIGEALDPEKGNAFVKGFFGAIAQFIAGPGLIMISAAFLKLFQFITVQTGKAAREIFNINSQANKTKEIEMQINTVLSSNTKLYGQIMAETGNTVKQEQLLLNHLKQATLELQKQQTMVAMMARSRGVRGGLRTAAPRAEGFVPSFAGGLEGAISSERMAIGARVGGARTSARPAVIKNFPVGGGRKQTVVANTDEVVVPKYQGKSGSAIFNKNMIQEAGGMPAGAKPVTAGGGLLPVSNRLIQLSQMAKGRMGTKDNFMRGYKKGQFKLEGDTLKIHSIRDLDDLGQIYGILGSNKGTIRNVDVGRLNKFSTGLLNPKRLKEIQHEIPGLKVTGQFDSIQGMPRTYFDSITRDFRGRFNPPLDDFDWGFGTALTRGVGRNKMGFTMSLAEGFVPNLANILSYVYDSDIYRDVDKPDALRKIIESSNKKNVTIGPSGSGKTTLAAQRHGPESFIKNAADLTEAIASGKPINVLSAMRMTKAGGISPISQELINSASSVEYLHRSNKQIRKFREKRATGGQHALDLRSQRVLEMMRYVHMNDPAFISQIEDTAARKKIPFKMKRMRAGGFIPNFGRGAGGVLAGAKAGAVKVGLPRLPQKGDLYMPEGTNVPVEIFRGSTKSGMITIGHRHGEQIPMNTLTHQKYAGEKFIFPKLPKIRRLYYKK